MTECPASWAGYYLPMYVRFSSIILEESLISAPVIVRLNRRVSVIMIMIFVPAFELLKHPPATFPIAYFSERLKNRKIPLLGGQLSLIASQVMLMLAPTFWVMALARVAQGISASVIWVVGLALV